MTYEWTSDLSDAFFNRLRDVCDRLGCTRADMLGTMMSESGVHSGSQNPKSSATGLIQFMADKRGKYFGMTRAEFAAVDAEEQLKYVERHMVPYSGLLVNDAAVYLAVFMPAQIGLASDPDAVVVAKNGPYGWAFEANRYFDFNGDSAIQVSELQESIRRQCVGPRWAEISKRVGLPAPGPSTVCDVRTIYGIQCALVSIGIDPGPLDGYNGKRTQAAVKVFQAANRIKVDGIVGDETRAALRYTLLMWGLST